MTNTRLGRTLCIVALGLSTVTACILPIVDFHLIDDWLPVIVLLIGIVCSLVYQVGAALRRDHWFQPFTFFVFAYSGYVSSALFLLSGRTGVLGVSLTDELIPYIIRTLAAVLLGAWAFWWGYRDWGSADRRTRPPQIRYPALHNSWIIGGMIIVLLAMGTLGYLEIVRSSGGLAYLARNILRRSYLRSSGYPVLAALQTNVAIFLWMTYDPRFFRRPSAWILLVGSAMALLILGNRSPIIQLGGMVFLFGVLSNWGAGRDTILQALAKGSRQLRTMVGLAAMISIVLALVFGITAWRDITTIRYQNITLGERLAMLVERDTAVELLFGSGNVATLEVFVRLTEAIPSQLDYQYGLSFVDLIMAPIPRSVWPDKPVTLGLRLKRFFVSEDALGGTPPSILGEFYLNFSIFGIGLGMFLFGRLSRLVYRRLVLREGAGPENLVKYGLFIMYFLLIWIRANFSNAVFALMFVGAPYLVGTLIIQRACIRQPRSAVPQLQSEMLRAGHTVQ